MNEPLLKNRHVQTWPWCEISRSPKKFYVERPSIYDYSMPRHEQNLLLWYYKFALSKYVVNSIRFVGAQTSAVEGKVDLTVRKRRFLQQWLRTVWVLGIWRCVVWYEFASGSAGSAVPILITDEEAARGSLRKTQGQYLRDVCVRRPPGVSERWGSPWGSLKWRINLTHTVSCNSSNNS